jgi:CHAT domain-containing protein
LGEVIDFNRRNQRHVQLPELYRKRARAWLDSGRENLAEEDLAAGLAECERQRRKVLDDQLRVSYFEQVQPIFDEMVGFQALRRRDVLSAFQYAESSRARNLLDAVNVTQPHSKPQGGENISPDNLAVESVLDQIPPKVALIEYVVLEERSLVWIVSRDRIRMREIPLGRRALAEQVDRFQRGISRGARAEIMKALGEDLYDLLIRPCLLGVALDAALVLIPDKSLHRLPFAALTDRLSGEFLLEQRLLTIAPSAATYLRSLQRSRSFQGSSSSRALLVDGSGFDRSMFSGLDPLPGAAAEISEIARLYEGADLLTGKDATKPAVLREAPGSSLIHFAVHGLTNSDYPLLSALLLAPERDRRSSGDPGVLYAHEIYRLRLPATRLVILSACGSAGGRIVRGEGASSLARPFLAAGVPTVVGSLWDVDDRVAAEFFVSFHQRLRAGADPVTALRDAQMEALRSSDEGLRNPSAWAGFEVIGGALTSTTP